MRDRDRPAAQRGSRDPPDAWPVTFVDVADRAGLHAPSIYGGVDRKRFIIETNGAGVAFVDYDNDGWPDALVLSGVRLQRGHARDGGLPARRGRHGRTSITTTATARSRTSPPEPGCDAVGWASCVCAGDYDNDGFVDLVITYYGQNVLYHNRGNGTFEDVTRAAGLPDRRDAMGIRLHVRRLRPRRARRSVRRKLPAVRSAPARRKSGKGPNCLWKGVPVNCGPRGLPTDTNLLFHNTGNGTFADVSETSGIAAVTGRYSMTAVAADFDGDGWIDIYVACDSTASILYRNNHDGTFTDTAVESGVALQRERHAAGGHGRWPSATTTATALSICSRRISPTTCRRCTGALARGSSKTWPWRPASACSTAMSSGAPGWPTSTTTAVRT